MELKKIKRLLIILGFCFAYPGLTNAQKQNNIWYFGDNAGLDFNVDPPKPISGNLVAFEGSASVCDPYGQLLFYTDGITVWDRNKDIMPNGGGLVGGWSSTQAALIVPLPNACNKYYVFTTEDHSSDGGLSYSVVDMCLNHGLGDVIPTQKNILVQNNTTEKITAILNANGTDVWIVTHRLASRDFLSFSLTPGGLNTTSIVSSIGSYYDGNAFIGPAKTSHDGRKIVSAASFYHICEMFDFNSSTGRLTNTKDLNQVFSGPQWVYGVEFSPNDSILYLSTLYVENYLFQINLVNNKLTTLNSATGHYHFGALQMGPDKKIYMARGDHVSFLDVIHKPDLPGTACQYNEGGQSLASGTTSQLGLPNFSPFSLFRPATDVFSLGKDTTLCNGDSIVIDLIVDSTCPVSFTWNDGSTSGMKVIRQTGTYWVEADATCFIFRDTIQINAPQTPDINFNDTTLCQGQKATLNATLAGASYLWSDNSTGPVKEFENAGQYWVQLSSSCYSITDSFRISVIPRPDVTFPDSSFCAGDNLTLDATFPDVSYLWSDSGTDAFLDVEKAGSYWVQLSNTCFSVRENINVTTLSAPDISLADTVLCEGHELLLDATFPLSTYVWSDHSTSPALMVTHEGIYWVEVTNECGQEMVTVSVQLKDCDFSVFMPNVFSPNGDGINETIKPIVNTELSKYQFIIFDRWGDCVFISTDNQESWNGIYRNQKAMSGVYAYYVDCISVLGVRKTLKGDITLIR